jgi:hypothetical protein
MLSRLEKARIANQVIELLGLARALEAKGDHCSGQTKANPTGFDGVDFDRGSYRARIRYSDCKSGQDTRKTLGRWNTAAEAGYAFAVAHTRLWGTASRYASEILI